MTSLDRGLEILSHIALNGPTTPESIAADAGLPLSTTYRYITTLRNKGYIADYEGHFDLGLRTLRMLRPEALQRCLAAIASPVMFDLVAKTDETALLTVRDGWSATCIEIAEPRRAIRFSFRRGVSLSLHKGASSKPLLAFMDSAFIHRYLDSRVGWEEGQDPEATWQELADVRSKGVAITVSELDSGALGIGVPVFWDGRIAACVSLVGPSNRLADRRIRDAVGHVREAGARITELLRDTTPDDVRNFETDAEPDAESGAGDDSPTMTIEKVS
ncbi:IclR family transcriptional regulator [Subtercola frigoramans]|uniref:DNA-binding IclR family transcriptional regulator n=1 Tax=Subtercola frigoramans TaxID=120298 RepID=A0ABS2L8P8_9MICO|nr:IclR family transcriptional regulator [Subtercola frigoramans]MBM7473473.1 DNA-binding IclR family transcriptional regulator [Subtercola frigoramans]